MLLFFQLFELFRATLEEVRFVEAKMSLVTFLCLKLQPVLQNSILQIYAELVVIITRRHPSDAEEPD